MSADRCHRLSLLASAFIATLAACSNASEESVLAAVEKQLKSGDVQKATIELKQFLQEKPDSAAVRVQLGKVLQGKGDHEGAEAEFLRALEAGVAPRLVLPALAEALLANGKTSELLALAGDLPLDDPKAAADVLTTVAKARARAGNVELALSDINKALRLSPAHTGALVQQVRLGSDAKGAREAAAKAEALAAKFPESAEVQLLHADTLAFLGDKAASDAYARVLALEARNEAAHSALVIQAVRARDYTAAKSQLKTMRAALPGNALVEYYDALVAYGEGDFRKVRESTQLLLRAKSKHAGVMMLAGMAERRLGSVAHAETLLSAALVALPDNEELRRELAMVQGESGKPEVAVQTLLPTLSQAKPERQTWIVAGRQYTLAGNFKAADAAFARAKAMGSDGQLQLELGRSLLARGSEEAGIRELRSAADGMNDGQALLELIPPLMRSRNFDAALAVVDKVAKAKGAPAAPTAFLRASILEERGQLPAAKDLYNSALQIDPSYFPAVQRLSSLDVAAKSPDSAQTRLVAFLKGNPKSAQAMLALADLTRLRGESPNAVQTWLDKALEAQPLDRSAWLAALLIERRTGVAKAWLARAQRAVVAFADDPDFLSELAQAQRANGNLNQASSALAKAVSLRPKAADLRLAAADVLLEGKDLAGARRLLEEASRLTPEDFNVERSQAMLYFHEGRPALGLAIAEKRLKRLPRDVDTLTLVADMRMLAGSSGASISALKEALSISKNTALANRLSDALRRSGSADAARAFEQDWIKNNPKDAEFLGFQAQQAVLRGEPEDAERLYRRALELEPEAALAINNLAMLLLPKRPEEALKLAEQAVRLLPSSPALLDTLAQARASNKQVDGAIKAQRAAIALDPEADSLRVELGRLYMAAGEKDKAKQELRPIADRKPGAPSTIEAQRLLSEMGR